MKNFTVTENSYLKTFTDAVYPQGSFYFNALLKKGDIRVNGTKVRANCPVRAGDCVTYYTTPQQEAKPSHYVVFEDDNVLIADKLSGVSSEALFSELAGKGTYFPVHRLDRNTSGLIALAKNEKAEEELISAFRERRASKVYLCLAKNCFKGDSGELGAYLKKDEKSALVRIYASPNQGAARIFTDYEVLERRSDIALVKVVIHTGKTHQIRAHLSFIGCPVLGDTKYGDFTLNKKYGVARQLLVAKELVFNLSGGLSYLSGKKFESSFSPTLPNE